MAIDARFQVTVWALTDQQVDEVIRVIHALTKVWPDTPIVNTWGHERRFVQDPAVDERGETVDG